MTQTGKRILIITMRDDVTADYVILGLRRRRIPFVRFNSDDFPLEANLSWQLDEQEVKLNHRSQDFGSFSAIWYRRTGKPRLGKLPRQYRDFAERESREFLDDFWKATIANWVSHPESIRRAEGKLHQLSYAQSEGVIVPDTLATNDPESARAFFDRHSGRIIAKAFREKVVKVRGRRRIIFTSRLTKDDVKHLADVQCSPVIFQEEVTKAFDIRVSVFGAKVFATRIDSQHNASAKVDWRRGRIERLRHTPYELPRTIARFCVRMLKAHDLRFGAFDFVATPDDEHVFIELNPNGQWAWIEPLTGQPLRDGMIDLLMEAS